MATSVSADFAATEAHLQTHSSALRKELGYLDLVLAAILLVVIPHFFGTAIKAGSAHAVLWLFAILLFFIPQPFVVAHLNRLMPLEGGLYEWTRLAFNDGIGFLVAWNLWLYVVLYVASTRLVTVNYLAYAIGPAAASMATNRWIVLFTSVVMIGLLMFVARLGLRVRKWVTNAGSFLTVLIIALLACIPGLRRCNRPDPASAPPQFLSAPMPWSFCSIAGARAADLLRTPPEFSFSSLIRSVRIFAPTALALNSCRLCFNPVGTLRPISLLKLFARAHRADIRNAIQRQNPIQMIDLVLQQFREIPFLSCVNFAHRTAQILIPHDDLLVTLHLHENR